MVVLQALVSRMCSRPPSRSLSRIGLSAISILAAIGLCTPTLAADGATIIPDYPVPNGHFYSQASGQGVSKGFAMVDDGGILLYDEFEHFGGVTALGYPSSQRFSLGGFTTQATQKELLQWRPESGHAVFLNIFDVMSQRGFDPTLAQTRLIPPTEDNSADSKLTWSQIVSRHLALLDRNPAIKARYFANADPLTNYGLPQGTGDFGGVFVIRCERAAFQQWRIGTSFASPGDVTQVNAGDLAKDFGLVPTEAAVPTAADTVLIAPPGDMVRADAATQAAAHLASTIARPSLVRIDVSSRGGSGIASGVVFDQSGHIITNQHVVEAAESVTITFANNVVLPARVVGADVANDLAVVQVPAGSIGGGVKPATILGGAHLSPGELVVALGYSPFFSVVPAVRLGVYQRSFADGIEILRSDTYILPGDSGGMLVDLGGNLVGINDEIRITNQAGQPLIGYSIDAADAARIARHLIDIDLANGGG
jgi:S1-C subfamily serine protease